MIPLWVKRAGWLWPLLPLLVGVALRFHQLGAQPFGIYHDEAFYGLDAVSVTQGAHPLFFPANNGREPLYIYILSLSVGAFGRTPFGLRLAEAFIGTLTIAASYALGRSFFNKRTGLLAMWICAATFWALALSRISFRAGLLPLVIGLALAWGWRAWQQKSWGWAVLGGVAYGLTFNTYTAARATPLALLLFAAWQGLRYFKTLQTDPSLRRSILKIGGAYFLSALVVVAPLGLYALLNPSQVFAREEQVSIFQTDSGSPLFVLAKHSALGLGMFNIQGDFIARHNLPGRPVFDLVQSIFFCIGLFVIIRWAWPPSKQPAAALVLIWLGVTLLPTILAEDTPHFLRSIAMLPVLWLVPAVGLAQALNPAYFARWPATLKTTLVAGSVLISTFWTSYDYFVRYLPLPLTGYYFESAATDLAQQLNNHPDFSNRIDDRLWDNFASLRFLIPNRAGAASANRVQLAVWPYEPQAVQQAVQALPTPSQISARVGPLAQGDLETKPYSLYTLYWAQPAQPEPVTAQFGPALQLRSTALTTQAGQIQVRLGWSLLTAVNVDYHVYVHVLNAGELVAQWDGEPLQNQYHFTWLKPGDILDDEYLLPAGQQVVVGVYAPDGTPLGQPVTLK